MEQKKKTNKQEKWGFKYIRHIIQGAIERNGILDETE